MCGAPGCVDWSQVDGARARAQAVSERVSRERALVSARVAEMERESPGSAELPGLRALSERLEAQEQTVRGMVAELDAAVARAREAGREVGRDGGEDEATRRVVGAVTPWIPEPARTPAALGLALVLSLARAAQLKRAALSIARSVETAGQIDPELRARLKAGATTLRSVQTRTARRLVDEAQGRGRSLVRIPV
jgi:hypothetical protein